MTEKQLMELRDWHEARMRELDYPPKVQDELRHTREEWISRVKRSGLIGNERQP